MAERRDENGTRERILAIAGGLFARQGYAGTSMADIANVLGTSKPAIYYYFGSKDEILDAIATGLSATFADLARRAHAGEPPAEILGAIIDSTVNLGREAMALEADPSVALTLTSRLRRQALAEHARQIVAALAGPDADRAAQVRASAAYAVARYGTSAALSLTGGPALSGADRAEILAAATVVLGLAPGAAVRAGEPRPKALATES